MGSPHIPLRRVSIYIVYVYILWLAASDKVALIITIIALRQYRPYLANMRRWPNVGLMLASDAGPTLSQHWLNVSRVLVLVSGWPSNLRMRPRCVKACLAAAPFPSLNSKAWFRSCKAPKTTSTQQFSRGRSRILKRRGRGGGPIKKINFDFIFRNRSTPEAPFFLEWSVSIAHNHHYHDYAYLLLVMIKCIFLTTEWE